MDELISKQDLLDEISKLPLDWEYGRAVSDIYDIIKKRPAIDAVKVVRCRDCVLWQRVDKYTGKCPLLIGELQYTGDDYYCSCGERKEENAND